MYLDTREWEIANESFRGLYGEKFRYVPLIQDLGLQHFPGHESAWDTDTESYGAETTAIRSFAGVMIREGRLSLLMLTFRWGVSVALYSCIREELAFISSRSCISCYSISRVI
jgi:hypothetical protein